MRTKEEIKEKFDRLAKSRNDMNLDTHAISTMMAIEHEIYALAWVLDEGKIYLPFQEAALSKEERKGE